MRFALFPALLVCSFCLRDLGNAWPLNSPQSSLLVHVAVTVAMKGFSYKRTVSSLSDDQPGFPAECFRRLVCF